MKAIERIDSNFLQPEYVTRIQPKECYECVYVLKARRKLSSIVSYTAAFDARLGWKDSGEDVKTVASQSVSFNVTLNPIALSVFAIVFSLLGSILKNLEVVNGQPPTFAKVENLFSMDSLPNYLAAAILALVLYNSIEMTEWKNRIGSISWRSAMFIGILCGLLSDRMFKAITTFVGG